MLVLALPLGTEVRAQAGALRDEPRQPFVNKIVILGNQFFSDDDLKKQMNTDESSFFSVFRKPRLRLDFLRRDIAVLEAFYHANGFLEATVRVKEIRQLENEAFVDIIIEVEEREATRVEAIEFGSVGPIKEDELREDLVLKPGDPYNPSLRSADVYSIKRNYFEEGYLGVAVRDTATVNGRLVRIRYDIVAGPVIHIRNIEIRGNRDSKRSIVEKELAFESGDPFRLGKVIETQRNLFETGLFTEAEIIPENLNMSERTVDIVVRVSERKSAYVEAGFGVGNILGSRVLGEWGDRNLFGTGRSLRFKTEYSFGIFEDETLNFDNLDFRVKFYRYDAQFDQRRLFGTKLLLGVNAFFEKDATVDDIVIRTRGASVGGSRRLNPRTDVLLQFLLERIKRQAPDTGFEDSRSNLVSSAVRYDTRDFILDPRTGIYRDVNLSIAGGILGADNDFYSISTSVQKYYRLARRIIVALRARVGFADAFGDSSDEGPPIEARFFTGGSNSVRGYDENSLGPATLTVDPSTGATEETVLGGRALLLTNAELRFPLPLLARFRFSGAAFVDAGNVWRSLDAIDIKHFRPFADRDDVVQEDYRYSVGVGIRYNTPVGPIRLDYGLPLKREPGLDNARFHVSLGQIF
ncbi:MAG: outer membrane protein assembly factor BamA [Candidatus Krumholzibacteria bacterium]